jgi:hypothetical protein
MIDCLIFLLHTVHPPEIKNGCKKTVSHSHQKKHCSHWDSNAFEKV